MNKLKKFENFGDAYKLIEKTIEEEKLKYAISLLEQLSDETETNEFLQGNKLAQFATCDFLSKKIGELKSKLKQSQ